MKILNLKKSLLIGSTIAFFMQCGGDKEKTEGSAEQKGNAVATEKMYDKLTDCPDCPEEPIDMYVFPMDTPEARLKITLTGKLLKLGNYPAGPYLLDSLPLTALNELKTKACDNYCSLACNGAGTCYKVTALKVWYGEVNNKLRTYYEPVLLHSNSAGQIKTYTVHPNTTEPDMSNIYTYSHANSTLQPITDVAPILEYQAHIKFREVNDPSAFRNFDTPPFEDSRAIIFTFQEIDSVLYENASDTLKFWSMAFVDYYNGNEGVRHSMVVSPRAYSINKKILPSFRNRVGNHANPCPPHCDLIELKSR